MNRKVILYISMSLDGYIADIDGSVSWLDEINTGYNGDYGYSKFIKGVDTILMGYNTYHQIVNELSLDKWVYEGIDTYVFTHRNIENKKDIHFVSEGVKDIVNKLKISKGKNIWVCGGADLIRQMMQIDLIDEFNITIMPLMLGEGIKLFDKNKKINLKLKYMNEFLNAVQLIYEK